MQRKSPKLTKEQMEVVDELVHCLFEENKQWYQEVVECLRSHIPTKASNVSAKTVESLTERAAQEGIEIKSEEELQLVLFGMKVMAHLLPPFPTLVTKRREAEDDEDELEKPAMFS